MATYRFYYWFNANITTETYIKAESLEQAKQKFKAMKGDKSIINIEEA